MNHTPSRRAERYAALPATLPSEAVTAIVDSREQLPLNLAPLQVVTGTLATGDYSIRGLEQHIAIERKSLPDLIACVGAERERFDREIIRLLAYSTRAVVVEAAWSELELGNWRSKVTPQAAVGSCLGWIAAGVPIVMAGDHRRAGRYVSRLLFIAARRRWREARALVAEVTGEKPRSPNAQDPDALASFDGTLAQEAVA